MGEEDRVHWQGMGSGGRPGAGQERKARVVTRDLGLGCSHQGRVEERRAVEQGTASWHSVVLGRGETQSAASLVLLSTRGFCLKPLGS